MSIIITTIKIKYEEDTVLARQRARHIAELLGFDNREQTAIATSVSEMVRNAYNYAKDSSVEFVFDEQSDPQILYIIIKDQGPGIQDIDIILEGRYNSKTGLGIGIKGSRKLMDIFQINTFPGHGTTVVMGKKLPAEKPKISITNISNITNELIRQRAKTPIEEVKEQNQELLTTLNEVRKKQDELLRLNKELEETNRGVVALYAELDERAEHLKQMNEIRARFFSNMSHEFKTPLNSISALSRILLEHIDGDLNDEQTKQVKFIQNSTSDLYEIVNDLLDIAKLESGRIIVKPEWFDIINLFASLRGMMRPLLNNHDVNLVFKIPEALPPVFNDESKIAQILRNFISNALKFTEKGEVQIKAVLSEDTRNIIFSVSDTGIGIAEKDLNYIFEEFSQVDSKIQKLVRGTGLGLPLSKKLAETLGGKVKVESQLGKGSVFYTVIPVHYVASSENKTSEINSDTLSSDTEQTVSLPRNIEEKPENPNLIVLETILPTEDTLKYIESLRSNEKSREIPVVIITLPTDTKSSINENFSEIAALLNQIRSIKDNKSRTKILIIDDEEVPRYVLKEMLPAEYFEIIEAENGKMGTDMAISYTPDLIFLDIMMPDQSGFDVLKELYKNTSTRNIPVILNSSREISEQDKVKLADSTSILFNKENLSQKEVLQKIKLALIKVLQQGVL